MPASTEQSLNQIVALALDIGRKSHLSKPEATRIIHIAGEIRKGVPSREAVVAAISGAETGLSGAQVEGIADAVLALLKGDKPAG